MTRKTFYLLFFLAISLYRLPAQDAELVAPVAKKIPNQMVIHGDTLTDNYFWLRDKYAPEVINHLYAENTYADRVMKQSSFLQKVLYEEFKSRRKENFTSRPSKRKGYLYYSRFEKGKDYPVLCRKPDSARAAERVILDINKLAEEQPYINVSGYSISPNQQLLYYGIDSKGNHVLTYYLKHIDRDSLYTGEKLENVMALMWAEDNKTVYYTKPEEKTLRQYRVYRHIIGRPASQDELVFEEPDKTFQIDMSRSSSRQYIFLSSEKTKCRESWYLPADGSSIKPLLFLKREPGIIYSLDHLEGDEFTITTNLNAINYRLASSKINQPDPSHWKDLIAHRPNVLLENVSFTKDFMIVEEKENAQTRVKITNRRNGETEVLEPGLALYELGYSFVDYDYNNATEIEYGYSNLANPSKTVYYNLLSKERKLVEEDTILGNFKASDYETKRIYAPARDGASIPITLFYKKGLRADSLNPCLLYSYGSYGAPNRAAFSSNALSYVDRGFVYAVAHIRGSNDLGNQWYEDGKLFHKKNTFTDFIGCAEYLVAQGYTQPQRLAVNGGSAGGLLMGAVANMRPDLFKCVVANVPFVDVINTMLDESIPLTTFEFEEWGNPKQKDYYQYMKSYSPYDNVEKKAYPNLLATAGYNDAQVGYWEPAKWIAKLRELKTDTNLLLLRTNMDAGHGGASGRFGAYKEAAFDMAFIMRSLGVKENYITVKGKIVDQQGTELPFVNVYVDGTTNGTTSNADGEFALNVKEGNNLKLVFQTLGYVKHHETIDMNTPTSSLTITMKSENVQLKEVTIKGNSKDPAYAIMREAIRRRRENKDLVRSFSADVYMKSNVKLLQIPKKLPFFINKKDIPDSNNLGLIYMSESVAKYYAQLPDQKKEEMIASKVAGQKTGFSWNRVEDVFVNFYEPSVEMSGYSERPFISPLAGGALLSYKYKYLGTFYVDAKPVHKIEIIPRRKGDPLFHGEMYINEGDNYQIYSSDLFITKDAQIDFVDTVHIKQEMVNVNDSIWVPLQMQIYSNIKVFGFAATDMSTATMSNYQVNRTFSKKFFGNELFRIDEEANKKDTTYWASTRPSILSQEESRYYQKGDSLLKRMESKEYKDSVSKAESHLRFGLSGLSKNNSLKGSYFGTNSLLDMLSYNTVEGLNATIRTYFNKQNKETRQRTGFGTMLHYGVDNRLWSGGANGYWLFDPKKSASVFAKAGRYLEQFNNHEPISRLLNAAYTLLDKSNYMKLYQKDMIELGYSSELANGLYGTADLQYMHREAMINHSFYYWYGSENKHFSSNNPIIADGAYSTVPAFAPEDAVQLQLGFKFIPFARYESYPTHKRLLETKWPELSLNYRKGFSVNTGAFNYDFVEVSVGKDIDLRAIGAFKFDVSGGTFFNTDGMNFADYKHFNGNQTIFLMNRPASAFYAPATRTQISEFHALNYYTYSTNTSFVEYHASHNFRGFFIGKIPLLRKTKFYEVAGINGLLTENGNYNEVYVGLDKILQVFRFDVGTAIDQSKKINLFYRFGVRLEL